MKVLKLCYEFPPLGGGGGRAAEGLAKALARAGHEVDLVTMGFRGLPSEERIEGVNVRRIACLRLREYVCSPPELLSYLMAAWPKVSRLARERAYDINHTHFILPDGILAYALWRTFGLPYVLTAHGSDVPGYNPDRFRIEHRLLAPLWRRIVRAARRTVLPRASLRELLETIEPGLPTASIPYGIDTKRFSARDDRDARVLVVTRMLERKGVQFLLRALEGWEGAGQVDIVGDGPYLPTLRALSRRLRVRANFHGWLDSHSAALTDLYESAQIFVLTSEVENFPVVLLEAMSAGLAIITTRGTGCAEVVGDTALLVPPRDPGAIRQALELLSGGAQLCRELGQRARERAEDRFSWSEMARRHQELYEQHARSL